MSRIELQPNVVIDLWVDESSDSKKALALAEMSGYPLRVTYMDRDNTILPSVALARRGAVGESRTRGFIPTSGGGVLRFFYQLDPKLTEIFLSSQRNQSTT